MPNVSDRHLAIYWDFENVVLSQFDFVHGRNAWRDVNASGGRPDDDVEEMLAAAAVDVSAIVSFAATLGTATIHRAFGDWSSRWLNRYDRDMLRHSIDLVQLFPLAGTKNGADIRLALDVANDLHLHTHITDVMLVAGDSDYVGLVQHTRRVGRRVTGVGIRRSTSRHLVNSCDAFKYHDALAAKKKVLYSGSDRPAQQPARPTVVISAPTRLLVQQTIVQLMSQTGDGWVARQSIKPMLNRLDPAFDDADTGARTFTEFLSALPDLLETRDGENDREYRLLAVPNPDASGVTTGVGAATPTQESISVTDIDSATDSEKSVITRGAAREVLRRILSAAQVSATSMPVPSVHAGLRQLVPGFDYQELGFSSLTTFLTAQTDITLVERDAEGHPSCRIAPDAATQLDDRIRQALLVCPRKFADILAADKAGEDPLAAAYAGLLRSESLTLPTDKSLLWRLVQRLPVLVADPGQVASRGQLNALLETALTGPEAVDMPDVMAVLRLDEDQRRRLLSALAGMTMSSGLLRRMRTYPEMSGQPADANTAVDTVAAGLAHIVHRALLAVDLAPAQSEPFVVAMAGQNPPADIRSSLLSALEAMAQTPQAG